MRLLRKNYQWFVLSWIGTSILRTRPIKSRPSVPHLFIVGVPQKTLMLNCQRYYQSLPSPSVRTIEASGTTIMIAG
uniref:Uncharacterized protein n=1 Tax=Picea glauca TaxID=3330 RepID=A0A117NGA3_PICGL|nr:hypothetical protein ABT39_MTgene1577 [Picea glauca]